MEAITIEETLKAPIGRVWRAWTDPEQLCPWFALKELAAPNPELHHRMLTMSRSAGLGRHV